MAIYRLVTSVAASSNLSRDRVVITPVVNSTIGPGSPQALADEWAGMFDGWLAQGSVPEIKVQVYDCQKHPHGPALATSILHPATQWNPSIPREIALCLSFFSDFNVKRRRGRLYIPAFFFATASDMGVRPTSTHRSKVAALAPLLQDLGAVDDDWSVYSGVDDVARKVTHWFVDDEWDIQRRRGLRPTTRTSGTTNE